MARRTADAFVHVNRMIEVSEVRQIVNAHPLQRLACFEARPHGFEIRTVGPNLLMTIHADLRRWNARGRRGLDSRMTVTAINTIVSDVMLMAELNWLLALDVCAGVPTRTHD